MGAQIWPCRIKVKSQPMVIIWTNFVELESPMIYTKIQPQSFLGSGDEDFKVFLPYMGMAADCLMVRNLLNKLSIPFQQKAPCEVWWKLLKLFQRRHLKTRGPWWPCNAHLSNIALWEFVCVEVLQPSQPNGVMSSAVSLPNHTFTGQA